MKAGKPGLWRVIAAGALALLVVSGLVLTAGISRLHRNLDTEPLDLSTGGRTAHPDEPEDTEPDRPADVEQNPLQILIIGSDTRTGNEDYGNEDDSGGYGQADVMMLLHLPADGEGATVISLPRDLMVPLPACEHPHTGRTSPEMDLGQLNSTLQTGPGCTAAAINGFTGLTIDHLMVADFNAVIELSRTIGGVEVCVTDEVNDPKSGLMLPAGVSEVQGEQALAFLRTREAFADGSDTGRIQAQQSFLASLARKLKSEETLSDVSKLYSIADVITRHLDVDDDLANISQLVRLAHRMQSVSVANIEFITVPSQPWEEDPNRLILQEEPAQRIFDALASDTALKHTGPDDTGGAEIDKSLVPVSVLNRSGKLGRDHEVQALLSERGFTQSVPGPTGVVLPTTQVLYAYGWEQAATVVAAALDIPAGQIQYSAQVSTVAVIVGADFTSGTSPQNTEAIAEDLQGQTAAQVTCQSVK